jgi:histidinol-phosphate aminotransferase
MTATDRVHGSLQAEEAARFGRARDDFLDFSANLNPYGPPASAVAAAASSDLSRYPDPACTLLRRTLAQKLSVNEGELLVGNGSSELLHLLAHAYLQHGDTALVFAPAFGEYAAAVNAAGAIALEVVASAEHGFQWDIDDAVRLIERHRPALAFLGLPNNPTGVYPSEGNVRRLAAALAPGILVLDEAYVSFVEAPWRALLLAPNVVVVRSLTKDFALPGLRLGYLVAPAETVARAAEQQPSWSVSAPAQDAALACLAEDAWLAETLAQTHVAKEGFVSALREAGCDVRPGAANFILIRVGNAPETRRRLLERGIVVRDCTSFGLPAYIRIGVRAPAECERLVGALVEATR